VSKGGWGEVEIALLRLQVSSCPFSKFESIVIMVLTVLLCFSQENSNFRGVALFLTTLVFV
jgi:hypothetical protein